MNRTFFLILLPSLSTLTLAASEKPNITYLMLDEWGYFESGHVGHPELLTPNIDRFASEGLRDGKGSLAGAPHEEAETFEATQIADCCP